MAETPAHGSLPPEGTAALLDQMFRLWIEPAIKDRGLAITRDDVTKALVVMPPSDPPRVLINDEVQLIAHVRAARPIAQGQVVTLEDISNVEDLSPANLDPNAGWIAFAKIGNEITIAFDFRRNRQTSDHLVDLAGEFAATAAASIDAGRSGPAIENGFAAIELAVKAEMFLMFDSPTTVHRERVTWWSEWVRLGTPRQTRHQYSKLSIGSEGHPVTAIVPSPCQEEDVRLALEEVRRRD